MMKRTRFTLTASIVLGIVSVLLLMSPGEFVEKAARSSATIRRLVGFETNRGGANSVSARVGLGLDSVTIFTSGSYSWQGARLPVFGGGFYAVPHSNGPRIAKYRIGYGIHNAFLFPFEQGGIPAFVLFLIFVSVTIKYCWRATRFPNETDKQFAVGVICVGAAFLPCMWVGQIFWRGFGTENFNTMLVVLFVLAIQPAVDSVKTVSMPQVRTIPGRHPVPS